MVYRVYVEKKPGLAAEAEQLCSDLRTLLHLEGLERLRMVNRYDVENIDPELFDSCRTTVFSEPQVDNQFDTLDTTDAVAFAVEYLPGQFDQRADSAAQCIQLIAQCERPTVRSAKVYLLYGSLTDEEVAQVKKYVINAVESCEAQLTPYQTLRASYEIPETVETVTGFCGRTRDELREMLTHYGFAMDLDDISLCQDYFKESHRDPTITELRMIDTYWSDHCRHTTFLTTIDGVTFEDEMLQQAYKRYLSVRKALNRSRQINLMDIGTIAARYLSATGQLEKLDKSDEINACTVKIEVDVDGKKEPWLLLFKNETHNHPTEIEPFGGAATCIGGAIRDPLSGRSYVYAAMRVTGAADPTVPVEQTLPGKLPQRKLVTTAAAGYSSYGNQIGLATGIVDEIYDPGYAAKRMEIGAVIAAAPAENVRREEPEPGDVVILLGGRTGRDGCGGATGSSKKHTLQSLETCGAEVQKGNAPEERKLQRLFRNPEASKLIKRCNDFGAGGVSVAIGELADGLEINLNAVPKKYEGLDGTELAISESQERMAVVVADADEKRFIELATAENLEATVVATVTKAPRLVMYWNRKRIVDLSRTFLNSNGAEKRIRIAPAAPKPFAKQVSGSFSEAYAALAGDLNACSHRGLSERFDSTIGAGTVLMPFGGKYQRTPIQAMVHKISVEKQHTNTCSFMSWGYNPHITEASPYHGAYLAVVESCAKLVAAGASFENVYLTFQEYFEKPGEDPARWGKPFAALLGALEAQLDLGVAAIGGKDSMSGSFEQLDVPPTLVSFAVTTDDISHVVSPEFKQAGSKVRWIRPAYNEKGLPDAASLKEVFATVTGLMRAGKVRAAYTPTYGGAAEAVLKMAMGNGFGFRFDERRTMEEIFGYHYGAFILEVTDDVTEGEALGEVLEKPVMSWAGSAFSMQKLIDLYENRLEGVYTCNCKEPAVEIPAYETKATSWPTPAIKTEKPRALIPVFPGTNCEYDTAKALRDAGAEPEIIVIRNLTPAAIRESVDYVAKRIAESQIIFLPGGFSGGDEPDGSAKFITSFFRNAAVRDAVNELLGKRDGLMAGICNGFQALIKLGLVPYGEIRDVDEGCATLTYNRIHRHQSKLVRTRIASNKSPWLRYAEPGEIVTVPISHGEGRFLASDELVAQLAANGQIATQYVDEAGKPTMEIQYNPNGSVAAIEGITSPDGRVLGKMGHSERVGDGLYQNVPGKFDCGLFRAAVDYFKL